MKADFTGPVKQGSKNASSLMVTLVALDSLVVSEPHGFRV